jgi:hypothetical protein
MVPGSMDGKIMDACAVLLGPQARRGGQAFLAQLDVAALRRAYRVLALATHPDAARRSGARPGSADGRRFIEASGAYELLMAYLLGRGRSPAPGPSRARRPTAGESRRASPGAGEQRAKSTSEKPGAGPKAGAGEQRAKASGEKPGAGQKTAGADSARGKSAGGPLFYHGPLPRRPLRLAEFLYFTGRISWQSLISALVWQRAARPRFGELARELRSITAADLAKILASKLRHEQTGETARRLRLLSEAEVERILRLQRVRHKPIGRYFVEKESMERDELAGILRSLYRHNARYRKAG